MADQLDGDQRERDIMGIAACSNCGSLFRVEIVVSGRPVNQARVNGAFRYTSIAGLRIPCSTPGAPPLAAGSDSVD